jgi:hypothetical protein
MKTALWQCYALVAKWDLTVLTSHLLDERWGEGNWKGQSWWQPCSYYKLQAQNIAMWKIIQRQWNLQNFDATTVNLGAHGGAVGWGTAIQAGRSLVRFLPAALWPWGWLSLWQKWVPGMFPGGKGGRCVGWQPYHLHVTIVLKSGSLNVLEPLGPVQVCNGIAFYRQFRFFRKTKRNSNPWFCHVCLQILWNCFWWNRVRALCTAILLFSSEVNYTERFNVQPHTSLRYSNSFLLQALILIILYKYGYYYLPLLIKAINFKVHVPQYIRCGKYNHAWLSILWSKRCSYL